MVGNLGKKIPTRSLSSYDNEDKCTEYILSYKDNKFYAKCYKLLDLADGSSQDAVRKQYVQLAKQFHPDKNSSEASIKRFHRIDEAYRELQKKFSDDKRKEEDSVGEYGLYYKGPKVQEDQGEEPDDHPDIRHTAPQHRQYLSNEGFGYGTPGQRQRQYERFRAVKAADNVASHRVQRLTAKYETRLATSDENKKKHTTTKNAMERLVEDLIAESMAKGDFDNLSGTGKPLPNRVIYNPYEDFTSHKMNQILVEGGFAPEWVLLRKELDESISKLKQDMRKTCKSCKKPKEWQSLCDNWKANEVADINKRIDKFNLMVPMLRGQKFHFNLDKEAAKVWQETLQFSSQNIHEEVVEKETKQDLHWSKALIKYFLSVK